METCGIPAERNGKRTPVQTVTEHKQSATNYGSMKHGVKGTFSMNIKSFMSGNQSFNQCLYAPLTRKPLVCTPAVQSPRKVYMKQGPILRKILSAGVVVQV